jgi:hypothetical protein
VKSVSRALGRMAASYVSFVSGLLYNGVLLCSVLYGIYSLHLYTPHVVRESWDRDSVFYALSRTRISCSCRHTARLDAF